MISPFKLLSSLNFLPASLLVLLTIAPRLINVEAFPVDVVFRDVGGQQIDNGNKGVNTSSAAVHDLTKRSTRLSLLGYFALPPVNNIFSSFSIRRIAAITDKKDALTSVATNDPLGDAHYYFDTDDALTSHAIMSGPLGDGVYVSSQLDKLVIPHSRTEYRECTIAGNFDLLHSTSNPILYVKDFALRSRTALKGYIYTSRLPKNSHKTLATTILVAKGTKEVFVMGIPKAKLSQIGLRVWCAPRAFVCLTPFIEDKSTYTPAKAVLKTVRLKPTTGNAEASAPNSFTTEEVTGKGKGKEGDSGCHPLPQWVKELFTLLPLI
ncbi:hypothetical protein GG344DRAFT_78598 [Lentinula edodes]|nr:hypothetical protein GG344DRAFT_78598 [Lentinula edodes]